MADYTTIDDPSAHFQVLTYRGDSSSTTTTDRSLTNDGNSNLQPDIVWIANRDTGVNSGLRWWDSSRGVGQNKGLTTSGANLEGGPNDPEYGYVNTLNSNGFGVRAGANDGNGRWTTDRGEGGGDKYVAWQWKVGGGTTSSNTDGNITTTLQTNSTAGISIGTYTGAGSSPDNKTIGHGLGAIPDLVLIKGRDGNGLGGAAQYWMVGAPNLDAFGNGNNYHTFLDTTNALMSNSTVWRSANFTTSTIPLGGHAALNGNGAAYVFYAFKNVQGFSKVGQYTGNDNTDGAFIYTGFKPRFVMTRGTHVSQWRIYDTKRKPENPNNFRLFPYTNTSEQYDSDATMDIVSNGFKCREGGGDLNSGGLNYFYIAFAENPFVTSTGIPALAGQ